MLHPPLISAGCLFGFGIWSLFRFRLGLEEYRIFGLPERPMNLDMGFEGILYWLLGRWKL